jgi:hypothetical protein
VSQSVLSVIGKVSSASNVERLDFKIINPQPVLAGRHKSGGANGTSSLEIEDGEAEEVDTGITTKLEIKIVCKHGEWPLRQDNLARYENWRGAHLRQES